MNESEPTLDSTERVRDRIDTSTPHSARFWNYFVGGKDNYEADRAIGDEIKEFFPGLVDCARTSRLFLGRAVTHLAGDLGIRQFLDVGTGLPTADNTHEVAQRVAPDARVVYVDNDPLVLAHARALLTSTPEGATAYLDADLHAPEDIIERAAGTLDLDRPVGLIVMGILGHVDTPAEAASLVGRLLAGLPSGSHFVTADGTATSEGMIAASKAYNASGAKPYHVRTVEEIASYFDGLEMLEPGLVRVTDWRPELGPTMDVLAPVDEYGGVGRKP